MIYIGADHRGFQLKETLKKFLEDEGYKFIDVGNDHFDENDDYPDFALAVAKKVVDQPEAGHGILICGSGVGVDIVANKIKNVRSALCFDVKQAQASRNDDNTNILSLPADFISEDSAKEITKIWLETSFSGFERHARRIEKINKIEII